MKRTIVLSMLGLMTLTALAQQENGKKEITSVSDIVNEQQKATTLNDTERHFSNVWGRKSYFNIGWVTGETMSPKNDVLTGEDATKQVSKMKRDIGASITLGRNWAMHKKPIANMVEINLDIQGDLIYNRYKQQNGGFYNSSVKDVSKYYMPWNLEDHKFQLGLGLGPSVTVAPFTTLDVEGLHFMKFNVYYHLGYQISASLMKGDESKDLAGAENKDFNDTFKGGYGHGLTNSIGFGLSWKVIGLGYEYTYSKANFRPFESGKFVKEAGKFGISTNRLFIQFRF
ncbi:MAG: hypothetical protein IJ841_03820 [Prevotella sp.]|nr:hypothetical protein [Prevotella sp.]